ncbi:hypothetical protein R1sor_008648 [Riccia sorocarpa]|uniref:Uncharacterized protein n=1 Tax=Riccia sorocarpa TaxID=122646 RepID=A0ABD3HU09_9MARC
MTRPPRPRYPSDAKNYHETRRPGFAHTVRLPQELLDKYTALKLALGPRKSHADVIRFLFEAAEPAIASVLQERSDRVVIEQDSVNPVDVEMQCDPDGDVADEIEPDMSNLCNSDGEIEQDPGQVAADSEDDEPSCCFIVLRLPEAGGSTEIQRQRPLKYPELAQHDLAYKLKSWIYTCCKNAATRGDTTPQLLTTDVQNAADHWAGDHTVCRTLPGTRKCVTEQWESGRESKYTQGGETHLAVKAFLKKVCYYFRSASTRALFLLFR